MGVRILDQLDDRPVDADRLLVEVAHPREVGHREVDRADRGVGRERHGLFHENSRALSMSEITQTRSELIRAFIPASPLARHLGFELDTLEPDRAKLRLPFAEHVVTM